ncbi:MAG: NAD-dependent epimerase/dehydratase family protein [Proteobacteria bacterium]|nr:NAD-dependent epimerase/dehydratase family protein [Desulfobacula sp.]MBU4133341.1 NAD-dependent epimerase/dehydratase family protein [Pseudomonadota bacterium]
MNIIITGSNGFIGKTLLNKLLNEYPQANITCLVRSPKNSVNERVKNVTVNYLDLNSIIQSDAIKDVDYIFHVAGVTKSATKKRFWEGNVIPVQNLVAAVKQTNNNLKRFINVSSQAASGPSKSVNHYKTETEPDTPSELYGASKLAGEMILRSQMEIPYTIINPGGVYGPGDVDFLKIFKMTKMGLNVYAGVKEKYISLIYAEDLVDAIVDAAFLENTINKKYFIVDDKPFTWQQIHEEVFSIAGKKHFDINIPLPVISFLANFGSLYSVISKKESILNKNKIDLSRPSFWIASNEAAKKDFGFKTKYSIRTSLEKTYNWYLDKGWL